MDSNISLSESFVRGEATSRFWGIFAKAASIGSAFLILASLTPYQYGVWYLFLSIYEIFSQIISLGSGVIKNEVMRFIGENDYGRAKRLFGEYHVARLILSAFLWAVFFFGAPFLAFRYQQDFILIIRSASFLFLLEFLASFAQSLLAMQFRFGASVRVSTYAKITQFIILLGHYFYSYIGVKEVMFSLVFSLAAAIIFILPTAIHEWQPWRARVAADKNLFFKVMLGPGKWDISRSFISHVASRVQPFIIKIFLSTEMVGLYGVAKSLVELLLSFLAVDTLSTLVPREINERSKMRSIFVFGSKYLVITSLIFVAGGVIGTLVLFSLFFENYLPALPLFYLLVLMLPVQSFGQMVDVFLVAWRKQKFTFVRSVSRSALWLSLLLFLIPHYGLWGAISAELSAVLISAIWSYFYLLRLEPTFHLNAREIFSFGAEDRLIRDIFFNNFSAIFRFIRR